MRGLKLDDILIVTVVADVYLVFEGLDIKILINLLYVSLYRIKIFYFGITF